MPRNRQQRGRLHAAVNDDSSRRRNSSIGLQRPTTARMMPPRRRSIGPNSADASKPLPISRGTGNSNPFPSSGESPANLTSSIRAPKLRSATACSLPGRHQNSAIARGSEMIAVSAGRISRVCSNGSNSELAQYVETREPVQGTLNNTFC
jgi:hypothetical protein